MGMVWKLSLPEQVSRQSFISPLKLMAAQVREEIERSDVIPLLVDTGG